PAFLDPRGGLGRPLFVEVETRDHGALRRTRLGNGTADPPAGADDRHDPVRQVEHRTRAAVHRPLDRAARRRPSPAHRSAPDGRSRTAGIPATPVASRTARTIASAMTSAASAPMSPTSTGPS